MKHDESVDDIKVFAALAYIVFFLPLLVKPNNQYGRFHANQALLLLITAIGVSIVGSIIPLLGWFLILPLGLIFVLVLAIMGIINASQGRKRRLPLIGSFDIIK